MRNTAPEPLPRTRRSDGENMHYGLSDEDKFQFDLQGFVVLRGVLSAEECTHYSQLADA